MVSTSSSKNNKAASSAELISQALKLKQAGKEQEALNIYLQAIELNPQQEAVIYAEAITLVIKFKQFSTGLLLGEQALIAHSQSGEIYQALEKLYQHPLDTSNYLNHYQQLLAFESQQPDWLYYILARQLLHSDRLSEAIKIAARGIKLYANFHPLYYLLGNALAAQKNWHQALVCYQKVQQLNPHWLDIAAKLNQAQRLAQNNSSSANTIPHTEQISTNLVNQPSSEFKHLVAKIKANQLSPSDCYQSLAQVSQPSLNLDCGYWLSPQILYLEITVPKTIEFNITSLDSDRIEILVCSHQQSAVTPAKFSQISQQKFLGIACFKQDLNLETETNYRLGINYQNSLLSITGNQAQLAHNLEFIDYLQTKADTQKHFIRESVCNAIIQLIPAEHKLATGTILKKLQYFLDIPPSNYIPPNIPFKIFIDYIIPLKSDGLFISGWLQDAYEMLEKITIISALGFSLELDQQDIYRFERSDVERYLQNTRYADFEGDLGFCAYVPVPPAIHEAINGLAELHSFRFIVKLQGNIAIQIIPDAKYSDYYHARQKVMQIASSDKISPQMLANCLAPAGLKLQQFCIEQVKIQEIVQINADINSNLNDPLISIIIPLYRRLDFIKVQLATMANDPDIKQCEIIYILDSPEQEQELKILLANHCRLYQLTVKLIIMERNSGYAAANNAGASQAKGKYLILLNSDIFAKEKGWMTKMANFYAKSPKIGALGAKLLYEDDSLQHAGMFFAKTTYPFWLTLHYYKGLPENYPLAQETRAVPAVTGACLMISQELYEQVGGLTTDYIIGDFEDSDLCFKCHQLGYESWYLADVSLYHLERQSVPLNNSYSDSLAWLLNGRLHQERWGTEIKEIMDAYS